MILKNVTREQWTAALRSGEYKQGTSMLYFKGTYCCLGVLCHLAGAKNTNDGSGDSGMLFEGDEEDYDFGIGYIPNQIANAIGIDLSAQETLVSMNDYHGNSFSEIANYIDSLPLKN